MEVIPLPQRQRRNRGARRGARRPQIGPLLPAGSFSAGGRGRVRRRKRNGKLKGRRGRNRRGRRRQTNFTGTIVAPGMPRGMRQGRKRIHNFDEDEFIADMFGNTTFGPGNSSGAAAGPAFQFAINPGQAATFPWLATIAQRYEKYVLTQLEFYYEHEVSEFSTSGTTGKVLLAVDYDAADPPPVSKTQMMDMDPHADCMPCKDTVLRVDCRTAFENGAKYVRPGNLPGGADIKTYDMGNLNFASAGTADNNVKLGELHVRYAGWFEKPVLESTTSVPNNNQVTEMADNAPQAMVSTTPFTFPLGTTLGNGVNIVNTSGSLVPPAGNYLVTITDVVTAATNMTIHVLGLKKNGAASGLILTRSVAAAAVMVSDTLCLGTFVTANGTDAFTAVATVTGTGAIAGQGQVVFLAV